MNRQWLPRLAAPAAFLLGVTVAVVLVRAGLADDEAAAPQPSVRVSVEVDTSGTTTRARTGEQSRRVFATVEEGDTLDQIALEHDTTVERLLTLNPNLDPTALQIGQRIRVR